MSDDTKFFTAAASCLISLMLVILTAVACATTLSVGLLFAPVVFGVVSFLELINVFIQFGKMMQELY